VVVDEEITVDAEAELAQFFEHLLLGWASLWPSVVERLDQAFGHFHVVFQFRALAGQNAVFDQLRLLIAQLRFWEITSAQMTARPAPAAGSRGRRSCV
jgi:hypothetical protein